MGIYYHSYSHAGCFPFLPIPIPNFVISSHSHEILILIGNSISMVISRMIRIEYCVEFRNSFLPLLILLLPLLLTFDSSDHHRVLPLPRNNTDRKQLHSLPPTLGDDVRFV